MSSHIYFGVLAKMEKLKLQLAEDNFNFSTYMENGNICIISHHPKMDVLHYCFDPKQKLKTVIVAKESKVALSKSHIYSFTNHLLVVISDNAIVTCGLPEGELYLDKEYNGGNVIIETTKEKYTYDESLHDIKKYFPK